MMRLWVTTALLMMGFFATTVQGEVEVIEQPLWEGLDEEAGREPGEPTYEQRGTPERSNRWVTGNPAPMLSIYRPDEDRATGAACLVFPGGGYGGLALDKEGHFVARWLAERGVVGVVVPYRCGGGEHGFPVPQQDAARAVSLVRNRAAEWGARPDRIGVMGFSAGGHLAAITATGVGGGLPSGGNPLEDITAARPDFAVLVYPVISMREGITHGGSRTNLLGKGPSDKLVARTSADEQVSGQTPPTLLIHSVNDSAVPVANPQRFYDACRAKGVPVEMHLYETGGHGYGMWAEKGTIAGWPGVLEDWLVARGLADPE